MIELCKTIHVLVYLIIYSAISRQPNNHTMNDVASGQNNQLNENLTSQVVKISHTLLMQFPAKNNPVIFDSLT